MDDSHDDFRVRDHGALELYMPSVRHNITKTIPQIKPCIDDQAYLFWTLPGMCGMIKGQLFCNERSNPEKILHKAEYNHSTTFFLENRNLHDLPSQLKGCLCAVRSASSKNIDDFKLCFTHKVDYEHDCLQHLE